MVEVIYHIAIPADWAAAKTKGSYAAASLRAEGFIHCATAEQVLAVAERHFKGKDPLVLLSINPRKLRSELKFETNRPNGDTYPHLYGPINLGAITGEYAFQRNADGAFFLPAALSN